jgi:uncharacterized membrane protein YuzA (DUF378 family)
MKVTTAMMLYYSSIMLMWVFLLFNCVGWATGSGGLLVPLFYILVGLRSLYGINRTVKGMDMISDAGRAVKAIATHDTEEMPTDSRATLAVIAMRARALTDGDKGIEMADALIKAASEFKEARDK